MWRNILSIMSVLISFSYSQVDTLWTTRHNGTDSYQDAACDVCVDHSGNAYVTGSVSVGGPYIFTRDYTTIKYSASGTSLWMLEYNGQWNDEDYPIGIELDSDDNVYVCGYSMGMEATFDFAMIKYNANGSTSWISHISGPWGDHDYPADFLVDNTGNVYITGKTNCGWMLEDYMTVKYNTLGDTLWLRTYNNIANDNDAATGITLDNSGNVYVTGHSWSYITDDDYLTIKYDASGNEMWAVCYNGLSDSTDKGTSIAAGNSGYLYVAGTSWTSGAAYDIVTIKYNNNGDTVWTRRYNGSGNGDDSPSEILVDPSGNIYVTGYSREATTDYCLIKYDGDGNEIWVRNYNGPGNGVDRVNSMAIDGSGDIYVTGESRGAGTNSDFATVKYDSNGNEIWVARYNGPSNGNDIAHALVLDDNGYVYVTGESFGGSGAYMDYLTIKYSQETGIEEIVAQKCLPAMTVRNSIFMDGIEIAYFLPEPSKITLNVYDIQGRLVNTLLDNSIQSGNNLIKWNGLDANGMSLPNGIYILHLTTPMTNTTEKIVRVR